MFNIVPSNRQEYLLQVLIALLKSDFNNTPPRLGIFEPAQVFVESQGMKHFVNMGIAHHCNVSMNIEFPLVSRGIYQLCRQILGEDRVPKESLYKREIMVWRIEKVLLSERFQNSPDAQYANDYWRSSSEPERARYLLAQNTADVFEQYMQFRPEWLALWESNKDVRFEQVNHIQESLQPWQKLLWQTLVEEEPIYPSKIIELATKECQKAIDDHTFDKFSLPKVLYLFAVNALSPAQLNFLKVISSTQALELYFFHINPCVEYWGDLISESALLKEKIRQDMAKLNDETSPNTLLANLGKQGRVLFNQLQDDDYLDFSNKALFSVQNSNASEGAPSLLGAIQNDLLHAKTAVNPNITKDNTVSVHSCHSHLREVQVLHDKLLHIIQNHDEDTIFAHDIIVLCPAVEEYAPYVKSVFRSPFENDDKDNPRLVCSIADRAPLDADPLVSMFIDMLSLPDSRFSVTSIIDYLHIESIQHRFNLDIEEVQLCEQWLNQANIFWGKDANQKAKILEVDSATATYTWAWGLQRLIKSALFSQSSAAQLDFAMLEAVEGKNLQVLAKLIFFFETLQEIHSGLLQKRSMQAWLNYMQVDIVDALFVDENSKKADAPVLGTIKEIIAQMSSHINKANHDGEMSLAVVREAISNLLSRPDPLNQFNTGQVTFCSMVPMRSVPFKVVCILGLNDGVFPRISQPLSIDLMAQDSPKSTDRSRRNEDRYMFLEAIVSAREYLYLSYQGHSIKDNSEREPSLVLREFVAYVKKAYDLELVNKHSLQAFNLSAFNKAFTESKNWFERPSFSRSWLNLATQGPQTPAQAKIKFELPNRLHSQALAKFFEDPLEYYAKQNLQLRFDEYVDVQDEIEPFSVSNLLNYSITESLISNANEQNKVQFDAYLEFLHKAGELPEFSKQQAVYQKAYSLVESALKQEDLTQLQVHKDFSCSIKLGDEEVRLVTDILVDDIGNSNVLLHRTAKRPILFEFCIKHAIKRISVDHPITSKLTHLDLKSLIKDLKAQEHKADAKEPKVKITTLELNDKNFDIFKVVGFLKACVDAFTHGIQTPSLLHSDIGAEAKKFLDKKKNTDTNTVDHAELVPSLEKAVESTLSNKEYFNYFFPDKEQDLQFEMNHLVMVYIKHLPTGWYK